MEATTPRRKPQPRPLSLTPEEAERVRRAKERHAKSKVDPEWYFIAEFGKFFGWDGVLAIIKNEIDMGMASMLLQGAKKAWYRELIDRANITYIATAAAQSKRGKQVMKKGLSDYVKEANI